MNISDAVRQLCLACPEVREESGHGMANFKVASKTFATYAINHHGDGRVALWLAAAPGAQQLHTELEPDYYFVPAYVGSRGWLGVELNKGLDWESIWLRIREAYTEVASVAQLAVLPGSPAISGPVADLAAEEIDPLLRPELRPILDRVDSFCLSLPECQVGRQFGNPVWKAGKKTFLCLHRYDDSLCLQAWVGTEQQSFLVADPRYAVPAYVGHNGWIDLAIEQRQNWDEIESLILGSYRHFALKRMLKQLDGAT